MLSFSRGVGFPSGRRKQCPFMTNGAKTEGITVAMDTSYPVLQAALRGFAQALVGQDYRKNGRVYRQLSGLCHQGSSHSIGIYRYWPGVGG